MTDALLARPIGYVRAPWREKFGVPRQSGLSRVEATIELEPGLVAREALRGLEQVSHLWVIAWFHDIPAGGGLRSTVRPPRLGGSERLGVLATRSPHRPNPLALSVVELLGIDDRNLHVRGIDLLEGTPVLDLKPYLPYADSVPAARCAWASERPQPLAVRFAPLLDALAPALRETIVDTLRWDPRPAHQRDELGRAYAMRLLDVDVRFRVDALGVEVFEVVRV
jgi:tRNA-Thr(GGU) m(6)t(6)A37 methyltransferase TsaA